MSRRMILVAAAVALATSLTLQAQASYSVDQIVSKIKSKIDERWECKDLNVKLEQYVDPGAAQVGWFRSVTITAKSAIRRDVRLAPVIIKVWDVQLDLAKLFANDEVDCLHAGPSYYYTKLTQQDLNKALKYKDDMPIDDVHVTLEKGLLTFTGVYHLGWGHKLMLAGKLEPKDKHQIWFVPVGASINGIPIPAGPLRILLDRLNPLLDMNDVPLKPEVKKITIHDGVLEVQG